MKQSDNWSSCIVLNTCSAQAEQTTGFSATARISAEVRPHTRIVWGRPQGAVTSSTILQSHSPRFTLLEAEVKEHLAKQVAPKGLGSSWITGSKTLWMQKSASFLLLSPHTLTSPFGNRNNFIALHLWHLLKLDIPSSLDHASSFQRKTFLSPSLSWKPFSPQPSRVGQFPRRENTENVSDSFTALVGLCYLNPFQ